MKQYVAFYNKMTESCFQSCVRSMGYRELTQDEVGAMNTWEGSISVANLSKPLTSVRPALAALDRCLSLCTAEMHWSVLVVPGRLAALHMLYA